MYTGNWKRKHCGELSLEEAGNAVENSVWMRLWTCPRDYIINE
jgi:hypothetical protein